MKRHLLKKEWELLITTNDEELVIIRKFDEALKALHDSQKEKNKANKK